MRNQPLCGVLIADDDSTFASQLASHLESNSIRTTVSSRGDAGTWRALTTLGLGAVVLEPNLPGSTWYKTLHSLHGHRPDLQGVIVTGFWSTALEREARALGFHMNFRKPVRPAAILEALLAPSAQQPEASRLDDGSQAEALALVEWEHINHVLRRCRGNMSRAAVALGIQRPTLYKKLRKHPPWQVPIPANNHVAVLATPGRVSPVARRSARALLV